MEAIESTLWSIKIDHYRGGDENQKVYIVLKVDKKTRGEWN
jgi:hypothetical protein